MRLFLRNELILLDPKPLSAEELKRTTKFKMRCRRYVVGDTADGMLEMRPCNNHIVFSQMRERLSTTLQLIGHELHVSPELEQQFLKKRELAEERYRLGNEIKRHDAKHLERFNEFAHVVNKTMVRPLKERQMWDAFFLASMQRAGNFSVPGSGKTATVLGAFAFLRERGLVRRIMVLCPKNAFDSWRTEWQACFGDKLQLNCFSTQDPAYSGSRLSNKRSTIRASVGGANLLLVNYEAAPLVADELASVARHDTLLVLDEAHRVKRVGGYYATAALTIAQGATATFALTGTPLPNTYEDLYNFLNILYPREYDAFFGFDPSELKNADDQHQLEINRRIQPFYCRTTKRDLGVPPPPPTGKSCSTPIQKASKSCAA